MDLDGLGGTISASERIYEVFLFIYFKNDFIYFTLARF